MFEDIKTIIENLKNDRNFEIFIDKEEDEFFEAKESRGYNLDNYNHQIELTKDVSSFANASGGLILIGLSTERQAMAKIDKVKALDLFEREEYPIDKLEGIIRSGIHPSISDLEVNFVESKSEPNRGIVYILIPPQHEKHKPFLMKKLPEAYDGERTKQIIFGMSQRSGSDNNPTTIFDIYKWIKNGKTDPIKSLLRLEEKLDSILNHQEREKKQEFSPILQLPARIKEIVADQFSSTPALILSFSPDEQVFLKDFFERKSDSVFSLICNSKRVREIGWDLRVGNEPSILKGECWSASNSDNKLLRVFQDGNIIFAAAIDESLLGWGRKNHQEFMKKPRLNPVALIESTFNFIIFVKNLLNFLIKPPKKLLFRASLFSLWLQNSKVYLIPGDTNSTPYKFDLPDKMKEAQEENKELDVDFLYSDFDVHTDKVCFALIKKIYNWFGIPDEEIPYTCQLSSGDMVTDIKQIKEL